MAPEKDSGGEATAATAGDGKDYVPLPLIGQIREKGFSSSEPSSKHWHHISAPEPRATPFPVARHRSDGPHWHPPSQDAQKCSDAKENWEDDNGEHLASNAQPLVRKKRKSVSLSKWKVENGQRDVPNLVRASEIEGSTSCNPSSASSFSNLANHTSEEDHTIAVTSATEKDKEAHVLNVEDIVKSFAVNSMPVSTSSFSKEAKTSSWGEVQEDVSSMNESTLESMTIEQITDAHWELAERFRPDILDMLRRRGKEKAAKQSGSRSNLDTDSAKPLPNTEEESFQEPKDREDASLKDQGVNLDMSPSIATGNLGDQFSWRGRSWTERVEAVRLLRFGLNGDAVGVDTAAALPSTGVKGSQWRIGVTERDFLRMEGDPSSDGYTIKEAVALARSMVPAQRSAALRLLGHILNKAMVSLQSSSGDESFSSDFPSTQSVDWQAIWAYALGPEPELVLTLRMALDDSHATAVVICARTLEYLLSYSANEHYFDLCESLLPGESYMFTAPVFQKSLFKESGLVGDCWWKYNVKPADMLPFSKNSKSKGEDTDSTVKDDASIANQDVAAGLIRMGILPRIRYLLEVERLTSAEDSLFSILIALSRHSPTGADAVMKCPRLIDTIQQLLVLDDTLTWPTRPKAIRLLKVLSIASKANCIHFIDLGILESSQVGLLRQGLNLGTAKGNQDGRSWLELAESLAFLKICIRYGLCVSQFSESYPALLFWIDAHFAQQHKGASIAVKDAILAEGSFHLLEALASTLPILQAQEDVDVTTLNVSSNIWAWKFVLPIVETSLNWLSSGFIHSFSEDPPSCDNGPMCLKILSSLLRFLSTVCEKIMEEGCSRSSWLPTFVPKLGLQLVKSGLLDFRNPDSGRASFLKWYLKSIGKPSDKHLLEAKSCLLALVRLLKVLDRLFASVKVDKESNGSCKSDEHLGAEEILKSGLILSVEEELVHLLRATGDIIIGKSGVVNIVDASRRGGPAPGVGVGWGSQGGGHWSHQVLAVQIEAVLVLELMELLNAKASLLGDLLHAYGLTETWRLKVGVTVSLLVGPCHKNLVERICCAIVLKDNSLHFYLKNTLPLLRRWLFKLDKDKNLQDIEEHLDNLRLKVEDTRHVLLHHVRSVWLCQKVKFMGEGGFIDEKHATERKSSKKGNVLTTIPEENETMSAIYNRESLAVEWAGQKLPLPSFWFWSPLLSNGNLSMEREADKTRSSVLGLLNDDVSEVIRHGLLLLFGLEALDHYSPPPPLGLMVPVARKIHALSSIFLLSDDVFLENTVSCMVGALQEMYVYQLNFTSEEHENMEEIEMTEQIRSSQSVKKDAVQKLDFEGLVDQRYPSFLDKLTSQFASVSYGDLAFGRQVAIYLRRDVSESLRLRVWKSLESECMLEFLPPLEKCCGPSTMYLHPTEESEELLKAYASAWASGALDRAIIRRSLSFSLVVSHVASFIFNKTDGDKMIASKKTFTKDFLLRLAQRPQFQESILQLLNCKMLEEPILSGVEGNFLPPSSDEVKVRCKFLVESCAQYSHLAERIQQLRI